jgi:peptidoglycan hydrolase-like protein with peptidoglycan-binding domain
MNSTLKNYIKFIVEQETQWVQLSVAEVAQLLADESAGRLRYQRQGCELKKVGTKNWFKKCTGTPTPPTSNLDKYVGQYEGESFFPAFNVVIKDGKLYASSDVGDIELTPISDNKFNLKFAGSDFLVNFILSGGSVTGGTATGTYLGILKTFNFTKKSSTPTPSKPDEPKTEDKSVWACIENFNKKNNQYPLLKKDDYRYEEMDLKYGDKDTIFIYYKDGRAVWGYSDDKKPIMNGKWVCKGDNGYLITWSDGTVSRYGTKDSQPEGQTKKDTNITTENLCPNGYKEGCVSKADIFGKKKALKACSKCDLVKEVQENPEIKARIFRLQKEAGQPEKTDNVFGPIMFAAIKEFQSSHGINPTGNVGELTLTKINPSKAKQFYLDRGGKKFDSGDMSGGGADYAKALQIQDGRDEREGVLYWIVAENTKDKKAKCSAYIKSVERGYWNSAYYYKERKCPEISGLPSYEELMEKFGSENDDWTPIAKNEPVINKTDVKNEPVINKTDGKSTNKPEVKPIYNRSSRQVLSPDEEL